MCFRLAAQWAANTSPRMRRSSEAWGALGTKTSHQAAGVSLSAFLLSCPSSPSFPSSSPPLHSFCLCCSSPTSALCQFTSFTRRGKGRERKHGIRVWKWAQRFEVELREKKIPERPQPMMFVFFPSHQTAVEPQKGRLGASPRLSSLENTCRNFPLQRLEKRTKSFGSFLTQETWSVHTGLSASELLPVLHQLLSGSQVLCPLAPFPLASFSVFLCWGNLTTLLREPRPHFWVMVTGKAAQLFFNWVPWFIKRGTQHEEKHSLWTENFTYGLCRTRSRAEQWTSTMTEWTAVLAELSNMVGEDAGVMVGAVRGQEDKREASLRVS